MRGLPVERRVHLKNDLRRRLNAFHVDTLYGQTDDLIAALTAYIECLIDEADPQPATEGT